MQKVQSGCKADRLREVRSHTDVKDCETGSQSREQKGQTGKQPFEIEDNNGNVVSASQKRAECR